MGPPVSYVQETGPSALISTDRGDDAQVSRFEGPHFIHDVFDDAGRRNTLIACCLAEILYALGTPLYKEQYQAEVQESEPIKAAAHAVA